MKNQVIYKYTLPRQSGEYEVEMPKDAQFLSIQNQNNFGVAWFSFDKTQLSESKDLRKFQIIYTGEFFDNENLKYLGTAICYGGDLVLHLFEVINKVD